MAKWRDYEGVIGMLLNYFSKNKGLNTVTAAVAVPTAEVLGEAASSSELLLGLVGAETAAYLGTGPVGWIAGGLIIGARALMAFNRHKEAKK